MRKISISVLLILTFLSSLGWFCFVLCGLFFVVVFFCVAFFFFF